MAEDTKETRDNDFSDETVRRFLLGRLPAGERGSFDAKLFSDGAFEERVHLAEIELADEYAFDRLDAEERGLFEKAFATTEPRRQQVRASRALRRSLTISNQPATAARLEPRTGAREALISLFRRPVLGYALGFAALLLLVGIVWVVVRDRRAHGPREIATRAPTPAATREFAHPSATRIPSPPENGKPTPTPTPEVAAMPPVIASFVLSPGALREGGKTTQFAVPQNRQGVIRMFLSVEDESGTYVAELLTAEDKSLLVSGKLKAKTTNGHVQVAFDVATRWLQSGDYQIKLSRTNNGSTSVVGLYYFRVTQ